MSMKKIKIKGKGYVEVKERVKEFHNLHSNGKIQTELVEMTDRFITKSVVTPDVENPDRFFTGYAYEDLSEKGVNSTSALENCETSSVGRALGLLGIGIDTSIASYDEVNTAIQQQDQKQTKPKPIPNDVNPLEDDLEQLDPETIEINNQGSEEITFGKYKGKKWSEADDQWLAWTVKNNDKYGDQANTELIRRSQNQ